MIFRSSSTLLLLILMTTSFSTTIHRNDFSSTGTQKATLLYMPTTWQMTPTSFYRTSFDIRPQRSDRHSEIQIRNKAARLPHVHYITLHEHILINPSTSMDSAHH